LLENNLRPSQQNLPSVTPFVNLMHTLEHGAIYRRANRPWPWPWSTLNLWWAAGRKAKSPKTLATFLQNVCARPVLSWHTRQNWPEASCGILDNLRDAKA